MKTTGYVLFLLTASLLITGCSPGVNRSSAGVREPSQLERMLHKIKPWDCQDGKNYTDGDWRYLLDMAHVVQQTEIQIVEQALTDSSSRMKGDFPDYEEQTKTFLLMRVVFDLPTNAPSHDYYHRNIAFGNFMTLDTKNSDGTLNLSWPLSWKSGKPSFIPASRIVFAPSDQQGYEADKEYKYMLGRFKFRKMPESK
jgi:hypothetical protein